MKSDPEARLGYAASLIAGPLAEALARGVPTFDLCAVEGVGDDWDRLYALDVDEFEARDLVAEIPRWRGARLLRVVTLLLHDGLVLAEDDLWSLRRYPRDRAALPTWPPTHVTV